VHYGSLAVADLPIRQGSGCPGFGWVQEGQEVDPGLAPPPITAGMQRGPRAATFSPMRLGRRAKTQDEADEVIDLRERLAPYVGEAAMIDESRLKPENAPATAAPPTRLRSIRVRAYEPRHLAP
jgi:hypothetical protein